MRVISPEALMPQDHTRCYRLHCGDAWAQAYRALRSELADPEVLDVIIPVAAPGSGKSTWLANQPELAHQVAFDAVWSDVRRREGMVRRILAARRRPIAVVVRTPLGLCLDRNARRPPWRRVPEAQIRRNYAELLREPLQIEEGWADVITVPGTDVRHDRRTTYEADAKAGRVVYRWRTEDDERVRPEHAKRHGRLFSWLYPPDGGHPGEDYGCRCWAELVHDEDVVETVGGELRARPLTVPRWARDR